MPEPQWLDRDLVGALHEQSLRVHGGLAGVRDVHVLEAAIASARNLWAYEGEENLFRLAAHLLVSLAKAHPYSDGNKRIAFAVMDVFLRINKHNVSGVSAEIYADMMQMFDAGL